MSGVPEVSIVSGPNIADVGMCQCRRCAGSVAACGPLHGGMDTTYEFGRSNIPCRVRRGKLRGRVSQ